VDLLNQYDLPKSRMVTVKSGGVGKQMSALRKVCICYCI
jgi:hypothetical protein